MATSLPPALTKKVGPFPVVGWVGLAGAGIVIGSVLRARRKPAAAPVVVEDAAPALPGYVPAGAIDLGGSGPTAGAPAGPTAPTTNLEWSRRALEWLIAQGQDPILCQSAIGLYLRGEPLTRQQAAVIAMVLRAIGSPPESVPPIKIAESPAGPSQPVAPAPPPGNPTPPASGMPQERHPGVPNRTLIETANDLAYKQGDSSPFVRDAVDSLAWRVHVKVLSLNDPQFHESLDPNAPLLRVQGLVARRLAAVGW